MPDVTIPEPLVQIVAERILHGENSGHMPTTIARAALRAAAPHIAAQALRDLLADAPESGRPPRPFTSWREWIAARADRIEATNG